MDSFGAPRAARGDPKARIEPDDLADRWEAETGDLAATGTLRTLVLHPLLMLDERWSAGVWKLFGSIAELAHDRRAWVVSGGALADWLTSAGDALTS
jgi:hypothetical protein